MKKETLKRITAAALAFAVTASGSAVPSVVQAQSLLVRTQSETQMASDKEAVYVNTYSASARELDFDENWKFYLGDASGADSTTYDDSSWEDVNLPHDYSIEQEYTSAGEAESAFLLGGTGWYRKHFNLTSDMQGKELRIDFDGVYMDSTVWVNGTELGNHPYGYTPFSFDITDYVKFDQENVITVKVNHQTPSSRWYSGSGIYRDVTLTVMDKVHVDLYGTEITTPNLETEKDGTVNMTVKTTVKNESTDAADVVLVHTIYEKGTDTSIGTITTPAQSVAAGTSTEISATLPAANPKLWSVKNPNLYTVTTQVKVGENIVDTYDTEFGFRYFKFDSNTGFSLNGEKMKLKGVCMHHDQGALGAEAYYASIRRQVKLLKEMGCNSIRITHNPGADVMIQACNEFGMLVIEEAFDGWMIAKNYNTYDYARFFEKTIGANNAILGGTSEMTWSEFDLTAMISRDYNAPSIILWSLGNEVWEGALEGGSQDYVTQAERLSKLAQKLDSTRPSTIGDNKLKQSNQHSFGMADELAKVKGVIGANYCNGAQYDAVHQRYPNTTLYGSETASHTNSRGVYNTKESNVLNSDKELTSYDYSSVGWGATASNAWYTVIQRDYVAGEYVWTGFDYLGEPTPANGTKSGWTSGVTSPKNSYFGIIDTAGLPKDNYYFYQSQWNDEVTTLHVLPAWNEDVVVSGQVPIVVYSNAAAVELIFINENGVETSLGKKAFTEKKTSAGFTYQIYEGEGKYTGNDTHQNLYLTWEKAFERGTIKAVAYDKAGNVIKDTVGRSMVTTTGTEAKLQASVDRTEISADGKDLAYITIDVTDSDGNIVPDASNNVRFDVKGDGVLVGVDNGRSSDHQSFQDDNRNAFSGSLVAIVQSTKNAGSFTVTATSDGLQATSISVTTTAVNDIEDSEDIDYFYMSKNYYVKQGNPVVLPETLEAHYTDGSVRTLPTVWDTITETTGTFVVNGLVDGKYKVAVTINMIQDVSTLLNYSTTTPVGQSPVLPNVRPAVMADGTILDASFPVTWETIDPASYGQAGTFAVHGISNVLGKLMEVTASVRVQDETITLGGSADTPLNLTQNIEEQLQSDTLSAIWDGNTTVGDTLTDGTNPSAWTNYRSSQNGNQTAEIIFEYATQQRIGEIKIHFFSNDTHAVTYPDAGTTKIMISENGSEWTEVTVSEAIGEESNHVKAYTYTFTPFTATYIKFCITNATSLTRDTNRPCTGITEIEIARAFGSYNTHGTADLSALKINGVSLTASELEQDTYYTTDAAAITEFASASNAAVTVLPVNDSELKLILESEDHKTTRTFTIFLEEPKPVEADDSSRDYTGNIIVTSENQQNEAHKLQNVLDDNPSTIWHSKWSWDGGNPSWYGTQECEEHLWVQFDFTEPVRASSIRYLPRGGNSQNGTITAYRVEGKSSANADWKTLTEGTWERDGQNWKIATFKTTEVVALRLVPTSTYSDNSSEVNGYASAAELRIVTSDITNNATTQTKFYDGTITGSAGSTHGNSSLNNALDGNTSTFWESDYSISDANQRKGNCWYQLTLNEVVTLNQLQYYPRYGEINRGGQNGFVQKYIVEVSTDGTTWETAATNENGTALSIANQWLEINFTQNFDAKYVRFKGLDIINVTNNGNTASNDMCIAELRLRQVITQTQTPADSKEALIQAITSAESQNETDFTPDSWASFQAILALAKAVRDNDSATQEEVDAKLDALTTAQNRLVRVTNTETLEAAVSATSGLREADYTPKTWSALTKALAMADAVDENASARSLNIIVQAITDAVDGLKARADKSVLEQKLNEANALVQTDYTAESWRSFQTALASATIVFSDANATDSEVTEALNSLQTAIDGLEAAETPDHNGENDSTNTPGNNDKNDPATTPDNNGKNDPTTTPDNNGKNDPADNKKPAAGTGNSQSSSNKQPASSSTAATGTGAKTGDPASLMMWIMVMLSMAALVFVMRKRSR